MNHCVIFKHLLLYDVYIPLVYGHLCVSNGFSPGSCIMGVSGIHRPICHHPIPSMAFKFVFLRYNRDSKLVAACLG